MIIARLMGGLGNQMFEYAFGRYLAVKNNTTLKLDVNYLKDRTPKKFFIFRDFELGIFRLNCEIATPEELGNFNLGKKGYFEKKRFLKYQNGINEFQSNKYYTLIEPHYHFYPKAIDYPNNSYIDGYWQSPKYFNGVSDVLRQDFKFKNELTGNCKTYSDEILSGNSICLHVRYEYINNFRDKYYHGFVGLNYLEQALKILAGKLEKPKIFVFSDNPKWCVENIKTDLPIRFVEMDLPGEKNSTYFQLMSLCKHFIISNSSFSWWGAWLSDNPDKVVIAPKKWFRFSLNNTKDLYPQDWIKI